MRKSLSFAVIRRADAASFLEDIQGRSPALPGLSAKRKQIYSREKRETNGIVLADAVSTTHEEKKTVSS